MTKVISVHSFRGGTGKSNLVANLAGVLASQGYKVGIIDSDIQSPGIHALFGMDERSMTRTLNDYLWDECAIADAAYNVSPQVVLQKRGSIHLVPSSMKASDIARILSEGYDSESLVEGIQSLSAELKLDFLFVDTHPGLNSETLLSIALSDVLLIIMRPDNQDFQGTAVTLKVARKLDIPKMFLVINKALPELDFQDVKRQGEKTFETPVVEIFPLSEDMVRLGSSGIFSLKYPKHDIAQKINNIAKVILHS
jgi:MinD-like ATPase involved in chromosome partitioning or flagellar assembly